MRHVAHVALVVLASTLGCAELGVVGDGTSISVGRPSQGRIIDGVRLPERGEGFFTRPVWQTRGQRYGTDELVDLITAVSRRLMPQTNGIRLVVADLSGRGGGAARLWHRSHQNGRDVDLLYFIRDKDGKPLEPTVMNAFGPDGVAKDGSGLNIDVPRTWALVRELVTAHEASVQWVFMYEPIAARLVEYALQSGEPEDIVARARKALRQPGDSAPHHDHMHVRIYCSPADRAYGCVDIGPMELYLAREGELAAQAATIAATVGSSITTSVGSASASAAASADPARADLRSLGQRLLRTRSHRVDLRRWR